MTVIDPVGSGFVASEARPGGNITGFTALDYGIATKWVQLLLDFKPTIERIAVLHDAALGSGRAQLGAIEAIAKPRKLAVAPVGMRTSEEIADGIADLAAQPSSGVIVTSNTASLVHCDLIVSLAAKHRLPAIYSNRLFVVEGGLASYGPDRVDQFRQAGTIVDRILKGATPASLPVQSPTKYDLIVNLTTARSLGLSVPATVLAQAEEVVD